MTHPAHIPITSLQSLCAHWHSLLSGVTHRGRSAWIMAHDADGMPLEDVIIVDGLPLHPDEEDVAGLSRLVHEIVETTPDATAALVLFSRPGTERRAAFEEDWGRAVLRGAGALVHWPVCCASPHGVTVLERA